MQAPSAGSTPFAHLRVARPTDRLQEVATLYRRGLGFEPVAEFSEHQGFSGVVLAHPALGYQLEFTQEAGHQVGRAPTRDNLLVFYILDRTAWEAACQRMLDAGFRGVASYNPYWDQGGRTFEDPDGYRVVLHHAPWPGR